jgi:hypothetical protein
VVEFRRCFEETFCLHLQGRRVSQANGSAIAEAINRWLYTAAVRVRARVWSSGICGGQSGARAGFLRVPLFPLSIFIPPQSSSIIWSWYNGPVVAAVPSGLSVTTLRTIIIKNKPNKQVRSNYTAWLAHTSILKMDVILSSEMLVNYYYTPGHKIAIFIVTAMIVKSH